MKKTDFTEIKNMEIKSLLAKSKEIRDFLTELSLKKDVKDIKTAFKKKHELARVLTVLQQKQMILKLKGAEK